MSSTLCIPLCQIYEANEALYTPENLKPTQWWVDFTHSALFLFALNSTPNVRTTMELKQKSVILGKLLYLIGSGKYPEIKKPWWIVVSRGEQILGMITMPYNDILFQSNHQIMDNYRR